MNTQKATPSGQLGVSSLRTIGETATRHYLTRVEPDCQSTVSPARRYRHADRDARTDDVVPFSRPLSILVDQALDHEERAEAEGRYADGAAHRFVRWALEALIFRGHQ